MSEYKLVPFEPTPEMVEAAEEAYMPFGDMDLAVRMAILAAPAVQGEPVATVTEEVFGSDGTSDFISARLPVGTKCKVEAYEGEWSDCTVVAHFEGYAVIVLGNRESAHICDEKQLRPICTPQPELLTVDVLVGALERINNMDSMSYHSLESAKIVARLALAAYRKEPTND